MVDRFKHRHVCPLRFLPLVLILLPVAALSGCYSPDFVYRLDSSDPDSTGFWKQGRHVITRTADSVQVAVSYGRTTDQGHKFRLAFVNRSRAPVTVTPTDVYAVVTQKLTNKERVHASDVDTEEKPRSGFVVRWDTVSTRDTLAALDPEQKLLAIDKENARAEERAENDASAHALFVTLDAVSEIATVAQSPEERTADATEDIEYQQHRAQEKAHHRQTRSRLRRKRSRWAQSALRRNTLAPGERITGFVMIPVVSRATRLILHVQMADRFLTVPYAQTRYDPDRRSEQPKQEETDAEHDRRVLRP